MPDIYVMNDFLSSMLVWWVLSCGAMAGLALLLTRDKKKRR